MPGSEEPTITDQQAEDQILAIEDRSTHLIISDFLILYGTNLSPLGPRITPSCDDRSRNCITNIGGNIITTGLDEETTQADDYQMVMLYNGVPLVEARGTDFEGTAEQEQSVIYGGWLEHSVFAAELVYYPGVAAAAANREAGLGSYSFGNSPGTNPGTLAGHTATWEGVMVGVGYGTSNREDIYQGKATLGVDFNANQLDVTFSDIRKLYESSVLGPWTWTDLEIDDGRFGEGAGENQIIGRFYGPNHEEVGGVFERNQVLGAFGAKREEESQ